MANGQLSDEMLAKVNGGDCFIKMEDICEFIMGGMGFDTDPCYD